MVLCAIHGIEDEFDVRIAMLRVGGAAVDGFDATHFHVPDVAGNFGGVMIVPAAAIVAGFEHGGEGDRGIELLWFGNGGAIFEAVEFADGVAGGVAFEGAAIKGFEVGAGSDARRWGAVVAPKPEGEQQEDSEKRPDWARRARHDFAAEEL